MQKIEDIKDYHELMGRALHLYGSIPVPKEKSSIVISKIIGNPYSFPPNPDEIIDIASDRLHDKIRFSDYFDSLLFSKDTRGFNFEGLISGLFGGVLAKRGQKYDVIINDKAYSVKFIDNRNKAPELGSYKEIQRLNPILASEIEKNGGLTSIFKKVNSLDDLKNRIWREISSGVDGWIIAYSDTYEKKSKDNKKDILETYLDDKPDFICLNIISKRGMRNLLFNGYVSAPKGGLRSMYSLALSSKYQYYTTASGNPGKIYLQSKIIIPKVTPDDLRIELNDSELNDVINKLPLDSERRRIKSFDDWSSKIFGTLGSRIRPDILRYIRTNKDEIIRKLQRYESKK